MYELVRIFSDNFEIVRAVFDTLEACEWRMAKFTFSGNEADYICRMIGG